MLQPVQLDYGRTRRFYPRRAATRLGIGFVVLTAAVLLAAYGFNRIRFLQRDQLRAYLQDIPGVEHVAVHCRSKGMEVIPVGAVVRLRGRPTESIWFDTSSRRSLPDDRRINIGGIGHLSFEVEGRGYVGVHNSQTGEPVESVVCSTSIDVGPGGEFAPLIPLPINSAADAVANYDRLIAALEALPSTGVVRDPRGIRLTYRILKNGQ